MEISGNMANWNIKKIVSDGTRAGTNVYDEHGNKIGLVKHLKVNNNGRTVLATIKFYDVDVDAPAMGDNWSIGADPSAAPVRTDVGPAIPLDSYEPADEPLPEGALPPGTHSWIADLKARAKAYGAKRSNS